MIGRWLEMLAIALFAYQITRSAFIVAMLTMLRLLPMALFGALLGAAADRLDHRRALIVVVLSVIAPTVVLAVLATIDPSLIQVWHLAVASFVNGICWAADNPIRRTMIGNAVGNERIAFAMSFDIGTNNLSRVVGPTLSGFLLANFGIASIFWFNTLLYAAALAAALRVHAPARRAAASPASFLRSIYEGFASLRHNRPLVGVFALTVIFNVFGWPFTSMIPVIGTDYLDLGPKGIGLLASLEGIGGLVGALLVAAVARPARYAQFYIVSLAIYFLAVIGFATTPITPVAGVALFLTGLLAASFSSLQMTLAYRHAPPEMRARLLGVLSVCIGMGPLGFLYLGFLADVFTPRVGTVALAAQGVLVLIFTRRYWMDVLRL